MWAQLLFKLRMRWMWLPRPLGGSPLAYSEIRNVGILSQQSTQREELLLNQLVKDGKSIRKLCYSSERPRGNEKKTSPQQQSLSFSSQDINAWGLVDNPAVQLFLSDKYDLLINTDALSCPYLEQVQLRSKARLKAGLCSETSATKPGYQLLIRAKAHEKGATQLYTYLQHIK